MSPDCVVMCGVMSPDCVVMCRVMSPDCVLMRCGVMSPDCVMLYNVIFPNEIIYKTHDRKICNSQFVYVDAVSPMLYSPLWT
jgi:hypothetical protein